MSLPLVSKSGEHFLDAVDWPELVDCGYILNVETSPEEYSAVLSCEFQGVNDVSARRLRNPAKIILGGGG